MAVLLLMLRWLLLITAVSGTIANLTRITVNGINAVNAGGNVFMKPAAAVNISGATTVYAVARFNTSTNSNGIFDAFSGSNRHIININASGAWQMFQGSAVSFGAKDTDLHVFVGQFNGDSTSKITVSGDGDATGDAGSLSFDYATFFANNGGGNIVDDLDFCEYLLYNEAHNADQIAQNVGFLTPKWGAL